MKSLVVCRPAAIGALLVFLLLYGCTGDITSGKTARGREVGASGSALSVKGAIGAMTVMVDHAGTMHNQVLTYEVVSGNRIHQGDIMLGKEGFAVAGGGNTPNSTTMTTLGQRWLNAVVPYDFDPTIAAPRRTLIREALTAWEGISSLRFVVRTTEADFVRFFAGTGCWSHVGRQGGMQNISLQDNADGSCMFNDTIMHEVGHTVGLWHEQSRQDRDDFVTVDLCYVQAGKEHNFNKETSFAVGAYDNRSIMHYASSDFRATLRTDLVACVTEPPKPTYGWPLLNKDGTQIVPATFPTATDMRGVASLYGGTVRKDLNKDGRTDLIWHQGSSGETAVWFMNGTTMASQAPLDPRYSVPDSSGWRFAGIGDSNQDGNADILWHNGSTGVTQVWYMDGVTMSSQAQVEPRYLVPDSSDWRFAGMGDFNYDGKVDILWHNGSTGATQVWYMDGVTMSSQAQIDPRHLVPDSSGWRFAGTGDFNYDGSVDILWHNGSTGATQVWYMDGVTMSSQAQIDPRYLVPDSSGWRFAGTGDFNSDGRDDILWYNGATGVTQAWFMNGSLMADQAQIDPRYLVPDSSGWGVAGY